ncbi:MAG TPA: hypothetical protein VII52_10125, partial [Gemmatimonadaceae bacterium]
MRVAPRLANAFDRGADRLPAIGDDHHFVLGLDHRDADHRAVAIAAVDQDDALAGPALGAKFLDRRALAVAALANREHELAFGFGAREADHFIARLELDRLDASGVAAHR